MTSETSPGVFDASFRPGAENVVQPRLAFVEWLNRVGVAEEIRSELEVVFSELASNAVAATDEGGDAVEVRAWLDEPSTVVLEVANHVAAVDDDVQRWDLDDPLRGGGRGLVIVHAYSDEFEVVDAGSSLIMRCRRRLAG